MEQNQGQHQQNQGENYKLNYPQQTKLSAGLDGPLTPDVTDLHSLWAGSDAGLASILASVQLSAQCGVTRLLALRLPGGKGQP